LTLDPPQVKNCIICETPVPDNSPYANYCSEKCQQQGIAKVTGIPRAPVTTEPLPTVVDKMGSNDPETLGWLGASLPKITDTIVKIPELIRHIAETATYPNNPPKPVSDKTGAIGWCMIGLCSHCTNPDCAHDCGHKGRK